jgi:hypothetical protein
LALAHVLRAAVSCWIAPAIAPFDRAELVLTCGAGIGHLPAETARTTTSFTIFEGTSEIQRMIIGRAVTGLNVR